MPVIQAQIQPQLLSHLQGPIEQVGAKDNTGFLHKSPVVRYRAISEERFVLSCDLASENNASISHSSSLYEHQVQWFWQPRVLSPLIPLSHDTARRKHQENSLWFDPITVNDSGTYLCTNRKKFVNIFVDVQTKKMANCSANSTSELDVVVEQAASIACPGKKCFPHLQRSPVKWHKNGIEISHQEDRPGLRLRSDKILLRPAYDKDHGVYVCDYMLIDNNIQWTVRTIVTVNIITKDTVNSPTVLDPYYVRTLEVELGKALELKCRAQFGFEKISSSSMQWYKENGKNKQLVQQQWVHPKGLEGEIFELILKLTEVTEEDLNSSFICMAHNSIGTSTGVFKLNRKTEKVKFFLVTLCCVIIILLGLFLGSMFVYQHWIEILLFCRNYMAKDETVGDSKEFDAFVSYAKADSPEADLVFFNESQVVKEETLALEHLPQVLENKYGYKLCLTERDILPGGAYTDDIVSALRKSRRAIIILSSRYVNGQAMFELEASINSALEDKTIKLILIQFEPFQEPQLLPHKVKKALRVLPRIPWKPSTSPTANKKFWKTLRYRMPVKHTKGTKVGWSSFFTPLVDKHEKSLQEKAGLREEI
ncbi:interleukin-18 receptor accessory protein [Tiliqua scincoides]|uniref:interleukin-18 receptor accessory protein n=1 Tax=Tiliqua scincoides TaxID=71010 RepID=UPI003462AAE7